MSVEFYRVSPGKFDTRTLNRKTLNRWTGRTTGAGVRSVFEMSCLFSRPRPWQFEIRDSTGK